MAGEDNDWWQSAPQAPTGDAFLKTLSPERASQIKALAEGRMALPSGYALRSPVGQALLSDVAQYDPTFDVANAPSRTAARKAFTSGKQGQNITSFNTAIGHLGTLAEAAEELHNTGSIPLLSTTYNAAKNTMSAGSGNPEVTNFNVAKQAVVDELERAFKGTGGNVHEIKQWEDTLNSSRSPAQLRGAIKQAADLLRSRIGAQRDSYNAAMGTTDQPLPMLNQHASEALDHFESKDYLTHGYGAVAVPDAGSDGGGSPPTSPASGGGGTPTAPVTPTGPTPGGAIIEATQRDEVAPQARSAASALEAGINSGSLKTADDAIAFAKQNGLWADDPKFAQTIAQAYAYKAKGGKGYIDVTTPIAMDAQKPDAVGSGAAGLADAVTFGTLNKLGSVVDAVGAKFKGDDRNFGDIYGSALARNNATLDNAERDHPLAMLAGEAGGFLTGDALLGAGAKVALGAGNAARGAGIINRVPGAIRPALGDALYGTAYGAGSSDNLSDVGGNAALGGTVAALGGALGRGVVKGGAALVSPIAAPAVRRLTAAGVTLTPGQILGAGGSLAGRTVKGLEDRAAGFPIVGDIINNARRGGVEDFNNAAISDALTPIGGKAAGIGQSGIADMQRQAGEAINNALVPIKAVPDGALASDINDIVSSAGNNLSENHLSAFQKTLETNVKPYLNGPVIEGSQIKSIKEGLDAKISNLRGEGSTPQDRDLADHLDDVKDSLLDFAERADPSATSDYANARLSYAMSKRVSAAAAKSNDGVFTPNQFRQAVVKRGYGTTTDRVARGDALMQQLSTDASTILPSAVPDSGTSGRAALGALAGRYAGGAALGGSVGAYEGGGVTSGSALTGAVLGGLAFSKPGLKAAQYALAGSRGKTLNTLGDLLRRNASLGGAVGVPTLLQPVFRDGE